MINGTVKKNVSPKVQHARQVILDKEIPGAWIYGYDRWNKVTFPLFLLFFYQKVTIFVYLIICLYTYLYHIKINFII